MMDILYPISIGYVHRRRNPMLDTEYIKLSNKIKSANNTSPIIEPNCNAFTSWQPARLSQGYEQISSDK